MQNNICSILNALRKSVTSGAAIVLILVVFFAQSSMGQSSTGIIRVATTGSDTSSCGSVTSPCETLQYAVDLISVGNSGTILVAAGTYVYTGSGTTEPWGEVVRILGKDITMTGGYTTAFTTSDPDTNLTIIDGEGTRRGISVGSSGSVDSKLTLSGVTLTNGYAPTNSNAAGSNAFDSFGGGLHASDSIITLTNVKATNNVAQGLDSSNERGGSGAGGGLSFGGSTTTLVDVELTGNIAQGGDGSGSASRGGLGAGGGLYTFQGTINIDGLVVRNNIAQAGDAPGRFGCDSDACDTVCQRADGMGGGIAFEQSELPSIANLEVTNNISIGGQAAECGGLSLGGGIMIEKVPKTGLISSSTIMDNTAQGGTSSGEQGGSGYGGGIFVMKSNMDFEALTILNNLAIGNSGGVKGGSGGGGGIFIGNPLTSRFNITSTNLIIASNTATAGTGVENGNTLGGAVQINFNIDYNMNHDTLAGNTVNNGKSDHGSAIFVQNGAILTSNFGIIADHTNVDAVLLNPTAVATFNRTLWDGNTTNSLVVSGGVFTDNNPQSGSPDFVNPTGSSPDFHIKETSDARNKATGSPTSTDIDGQRRPNGSTSDLGADEYYTSSLGGRCAIYAPATGRLHIPTIDAGALGRFDVTLDPPYDILNVIPINGNGCEDAAYDVSTGEVHIPTLDAGALGTFDVRLAPPHNIVDLKPK